MRIPAKWDPWRPVALAILLAHGLGTLWALAGVLLGLGALAAFRHRGDFAGLVALIGVIVGAMAVACLVAAVAFLFLAGRLRAGRGWAAVALVVLGLVNGTAVASRLVCDVGAFRYRRLRTNQWIEAGGGWPWVQIAALLALAGSVALVWFAARSVRAVITLRPLEADRRAGPPRRGFAPVLPGDRMGGG